MVFQLLLVFKTFNSPTPASSAPAPKQRLGNRTRAVDPFTALCVFSSCGHMSPVWKVSGLPAFSIQCFNCDSLDVAVVSPAVRGVEM